MIPHRLNLLSPEKRQHLKRMINFQFTKNLLEVLVFFLSIICISLLGGQWTLEDYFNKLADHVVTISNKYGESNQQIKTINQQIYQIELIQKEYYSWTPHLTELSSMVPVGITLNTLTLNQKSGELNLTGEAPTRNNLLDLKKQLETLDWIDTINIPPTQLTEKTNIKFSLSSKIANKQKTTK